MILDSLRRTGVSRAMHGLMLGVATGARFAPKLRAERARMRIDRDVTYGVVQGRALTLDVFSPPSLGPHPLFLYVHGGGFRLGSKATHWAMAIPLVRAGFVVMMPNYRLAPRDPYPAAIEDAAAALCFAHDEAERFDADASRIVIGGESAGGNLTLGLGVACAFARDESFARDIARRRIVPRALMPMCALGQTTDPERFRRAGHVNPFIFDRIRVVSEGYLDGVPTRVDRTFADPLCLLESDVPTVRPFAPTFASCGLADPIVEDTRRIARALRARGVPVEAPLYPGEPHAFQALVFRETAWAQWGAAVAFLGAHVPGLTPLRPAW